MPREKGNLGKALRRALGEEFPLPTSEAREGGVSLLMNEKRQEILQYACNNPCSHLRQMARNLRIPTQTIKWHLDRLVAGGFLSFKIWKGKRVFYPFDWIESEDVDVFASLYLSTRRKIFEAISGKPGISQTDLSVLLGTYQQAIQPHLILLESLGLISSSLEGKSKRYRKTGKMDELRSKYALREEDFLNTLMEALQKDGVIPKLEERKGKEVVIRISTGQETSLLNILLNPVIQEKGSGPVGIF